LINYDPNSSRVHAFVEGTPDLAFYRIFLERYTTADNLYMYNCEGKARVYEVYQNIVARFPRSRLVLFFVDKDLDDIIGQAWPVDPRIFITEVYSVENYLVCEGVASRFLADFVKVKKLEVDFTPVVAQMTAQLRGFYLMVLPVMAWIVTLRRVGKRPNLAGVNLGEFMILVDSGIARRKGTHAFAYLQSVTGISLPPGVWKQVRQTCVELKRMYHKRYVRGKFEAWFMLEFLKRLIAELGAVAKHSGGSISISAQLHESNFAQLLVRGLPIPLSLESFLGFHFTAPAGQSTPVRANAITRALRQIGSWFGA